MHADMALIYDGIDFKYLGKLVERINGLVMRRNDKILSQNKINLLFRASIMAMFNDREVKNEVQIIGVDISLDKLYKNPYISKIACDVHYMPIKTGTINAVISQDLFEHLQRPDTMISEMHRILKPCGKIIFKIPNKNSIFGFFTRLTPYWLHKIYWKMALSDYPDVTPTFYKFNDKKTIKRLAAENGFKINNVEYFCSFPPAPSILPFFIYIPYLLILKIINTSKRLKSYSDVIVCCIEKA